MQRLAARNVLNLLHYDSASVLMKHSSWQLMLSACQSSVPAGHSGESVADLAGLPVNTYFTVPQDSVPEAEATFYHETFLTNERVHQSHYGCRGALAAFGALKGRSLMHRAVLKDLINTAEQASLGKGRKKIILEGYSGSGKSVALYLLVAWARSKGWLVMYIPSAKHMLEGGLYVHDEEEGLWDTPVSARNVLKALQLNHGTRLEELTATKQKSSLKDMITYGLKSDTPAKDVVQTLIDVKNALLEVTDEPVLIAIDDYNALYAPQAVEYHEAVHTFHRRRLLPTELRLASSCRVLEGAEVSKGLIAVANTYSNSISPKLRVPCPKGSRFNIPRYNLSEVTAMAQAYIGERNYDLSEEALKRALFLTNGNAKELRNWGSTLLESEDPLVGMSWGYKVKAAAVKSFNASDFM